MAKPVPVGPKPWKLMPVASKQQFTFTSADKIAFAAVNGIKHAPTVRYVVAHGGVGRMIAEVWSALVPHDVNIVNSGYMQRQAQFRTHPDYDLARVAELAEALVKQGATEVVAL